MVDDHLPGSAAKSFTVESNAILNNALNASGDSAAILSSFSKSGSTTKPPCSSNEIIYSRSSVNDQRCLLGPRNPNTRYRHADALQSCALSFRDRISSLQREHWPQPLPRLTLPLHIAPCGNVIFLFSLGIDTTMIGNTNQALPIFCPRCLHMAS